MADPELRRFVERALAAGVSREDATRALEDAGWSRAQIRDALDDWADVSFAVPVPRPRPQLSARDAFVYLLIFGALFLAVGHLGALLFAFVDLALTDPLERFQGFLRGRIRWSVSMLAVAWPVFLVLSMRTARAVDREPVRRNSAVRRWLTFLTPTVTAFVLVGDLVGLLNALLSGGLTLRFVLKALIVGVLAGAVLGYYLHQARADDRALAR
jgi:type III secretory pathway component EscS